jgi:hypothetical protein
MIRHVAVFKLTPSDSGLRAFNLAGMQERLAALVGVVPGLRSMVVEPDLGLDPGNWEVAIMTEHDDLAAYEAYQAHPAHAEASSWIDVFIADRAVVDFELPG